VLAVFVVAGTEIWAGSLGPVLGRELCAVLERGAEGWRAVPEPCAAVDEACRPDDPAVAFWSRFGAEEKQPPLESLDCKFISLKGRLILFSG